MSARAGVAAFFVAVALAVSGCGRSSESAGRFRAQAAHVCADALGQGAQIRPPAVPAATATFLRRGLAVLQSQLGQLSALRPPNGQAGTFAAAVEALRRETVILGATVRDLDRGADPLTTIKPLQHRLAPVEAAGDGAWRALDVPACVSR